MNKKYECPYCRYLYDEIYLANGGKGDCFKSYFDCDIAFQTCDNLYYFLRDVKDIKDINFKSEDFNNNVEFKKICEEYLRSNDDILEKIEKLYIPQKEDFENGKYLIFCLKHFIKKENLFLNRSIDSELKEYYESTIKQFQTLNSKSPDMAKLFTIMFNILTIMNSVALTDETRTAQLIVSEPNCEAIVMCYKFKEITIKLCKHNLYMFTPSPTDIIRYTKLLIGLKSLKNKNGEAKDIDPKDTKLFARFMKSYIELSNFSYKLWSRNKKYAVASRELYFFKILNSTYHTAKQAKIWEV